MALKVMEKDIAETEDIPIVVVTSIDIVSNLKGCHVYKSVFGTNSTRTGVWRN